MSRPLVTLAASNPKTDAITLTAAQEAMLFAGGLYVNIHTSTYPNGEIRGQSGRSPRGQRPTRPAVSASANGLEPPM